MFNKSNKKRTRKAMEEEEEEEEDEDIIEEEREEDNNKLNQDNEGFYRFKAFRFSHSLILLAFTHAHVFS